MLKINIRSCPNIYYDCIEHAYKQDKNVCILTDFLLLIDGGVFSESSFLLCIGLVCVDAESIW